MAHHVLFLQTKAIGLTPTLVHSFPQGDECNSDYTYLARPKKEVIVMGNRAFNNFLASIQAKITNLNNTIILEKCTVSFKRKANASDTQAAKYLAATEDNMKNRKQAIKALKVFFVTLKKDWSKGNNHIIGQVICAPLITGLNAPHSYTKDVCVIKLNKKKIWPNFMGNVIDLGVC